LLSPDAALLPTPVTEPLTGNGHARNLGKEVALLPSPRTSDTNGAGHHGDGGMDLRTAVAEIPLFPTPTASEGRKGDMGQTATERRAAGHEVYIANALAEIPLLPTPAVNDMGAAYTPEEWDEWTATMKAKHNNGNGHGKSLNVEAQRLSLDVEGDHLLPTPRATDGTKGGPNQRGSSGDLMLPSAVNLLPTPTAMDSRSSDGNPDTTGTHGTTLTDATVRQPARWGEYEPAIRRWEAVTRPAPEPTKLNAKGNPKLSDEFDEWLMGYPKGWITDVPGVTWNEALKACGNGVVPQQAAAALRHLLARAEQAVA